MTYDTARKLAAEIKECDEYKALKRIADKIHGDKTTVGLLNDYHKLQMEAQQLAALKQDHKEALEKLNKLVEVLKLNPDASEFLAAEFRMNTVMNDIFRIISEATAIKSGE